MLYCCSNKNWERKVIEETQALLTIIVQTREIEKEISYISVASGSLKREPALEEGERSDLSMDFGAEPIYD